MATDLEEKKLNQESQTKPVVWFLLSNGISTIVCYLLPKNSSGTI